MEDERPLRVVPKGEEVEDLKGVLGGEIEDWREEGDSNEVEVREYRTAMEHAIVALERAETIAEIKTLHDQAKGIHAFAVLRKDGFHLQQAAAALRIKAEHKAGQLLFKIERERGKRTDTEQEQTKYQQILQEESIGETTALRWQRMAMINEHVLQDYLAKMLAAGAEITTADVLRLTESAPAPPEKRAKFPGKTLKVLLFDMEEMDMEEQEALIWDAIYRAYEIAKKQPMDPQVKITRHIPAYWLAYLCAEYLAGNPREEE